MKEKLEKLRASCINQKTETLKKFSGDVYNRFAWDGEDLYKVTVKIHHLNEIISTLEANSKSENKAVVDKDKIIQWWTKKVLSSKLMNRSTSHMHAYTSLWEKEAIVDLIETISITF